ncbi:hypothetical protein QE359_000390 [Curtobacterium sp. SORGH_AS776]|nr:hypothetical protein [Curtobacterium sp. SORGH_AS_0776]
MRRAETLWTGRCCRSRRSGGSVSVAWWSSAERVGRVPGRARPGGACSVLVAVARRRVARGVGSVGVHRETVVPRVQAWARAGPCSSSSLVSRRLVACSSSSGGADGSSRARRRRAVPTARRWLWEAALRGQRCRDGGRTPVGVRRDGRVCGTRADATCPTGRSCVGSGPHEEHETRTGSRRHGSGRRVHRHSSRRHRHRCVRGAAGRCLSWTLGPSACLSRSLTDYSQSNVVRKRFPELPVVRLSGRSAARP